MSKHIKLSKEDWKKIGSEIKNFRDEYHDLFKVLNKSAPKTCTRKGLKDIESGIFNLQNVLEERMLEQHPDMGDEFSNYFYGKSDK